MIRIAPSCLLAAALAVAPLAAQPPLQDLHGNGNTNPRSSTGVMAPEVALPPLVRFTAKPTAGRWLAVLPLEPGSRVSLLPVRDGDRELAIVGGHSGSTLVCVGGQNAATLCQKVLFRHGFPAPVDGPVPGVRVTGRLMLGSAPASGVEVRVLPHPLPGDTLVTVPFARDDKGLVTTVTTDEEGRFVVPLLAPGGYRLELRSPGSWAGQGAPFKVADPHKMGQAAEGGDAPTLDLGSLNLQQKGP